MKEFEHLAKKATALVERLQTIEGMLNRCHEFKGREGILKFAVAIGGNWEDIPVDVENIEVIELNTHGNPVGGE